MYPDGRRQAFEKEKSDEYICHCGRWVNVEDCPYISEHFYGFYYSALCPECFNLRKERKNRESRARRQAEKNQKFIDKLCRTQTLKPEAACRFVQQFRYQIGGIEGVADRLVRLIDKALEDPNASKMAALKALELYISMTKVVLAEEHVGMIVPKPAPAKHKLMDADF